MSPEKKWVNPDVLRWARERLKLTPRQVAEESSRLAEQYYEPISEQDLAAWENGEAEPELAHLETLSQIYVCPVGWFFLDTLPTEKLPLSFHGLAKPREELGSLSRRAIHLFVELAEWMVKAKRETGYPSVIKISPAEVTPCITYAERIATEFKLRLRYTAEQRQRLAGKPRETYHWWRSAIESQGVFCIELSLEKEIRGAALWMESFPFILVNKEMDSEACRVVTLLHEFAHLISSQEGVVCDFHGAQDTTQLDNPEPFANRFAERILSGIQ
jgi:transcriptional regulator with XRE-family HTH domain